MCSRLPTPLPPCYYGRKAKPPQASLQCSPAFTSNYPCFTPILSYPLFLFFRSLYIAGQYFRYYNVSDILHNNHSFYRLFFPFFFFSFFFSPFLTFSLVILFLYFYPRVCVAIFTSQPVVIQICLNGEAIVTTHDSNNCYDNSYALSNSDSTGLTNSKNNNNKSNKNLNNNGGRLISHSTHRRHRHPAGEVSSVSTEQYVSLPPNAIIGVRFNAEKTVGVQGFMTISKL